MSVDVLLGLQWGDEGKGKVVDYLARKYDLVARFQGGPNAGHTLEFEGIKHVLHQIPSGIFHKELTNIVGNGVVLDPVIFMKEIDKLDRFDIDLDQQLYLSQKAQLILPTHRILDAAYENAKGDKKIGSTLRGIGPAYQDKIARMGLRVGDMQAENFRERYETLRKKHLRILNSLNHEFDLDSLEKEFFDAVDRMKKLNLVNSEYYINKYISEGKSILAEGAQGSLLDVDFGSYPFVTSSTTTAAGACTGLGIAPSRIGEVFGIFKAYCTRVGSGPFPTELFDADGELLRKTGNEFGATTGRPRRCGWLDLPALKYAVMINGVTQLFMMKADVLSGFDKIKVCTHYKDKEGNITEEIGFEQNDDLLTPVYKEIDGWHDALDDVTEYDQLPTQLHDYISYIEEETGVPINIISVGPDRKQTIIKEALVIS
ncbi:MAG: adenylosuccinate synthase [Cyclobacteriaceae bacterium]